MSSIPDDLRYSNDHIWVRPDHDHGLLVVGLSDFAQESLGDLVAVDLPTVSDDIEAGQPCGDVESTKSLSDLIAPVGGTVTSVNAALTDSPELVNSDPYGSGWLFQVAVAADQIDATIKDLLTPQQYRKLTEEN